MMSFVENHKRLAWAFVLATALELLVWLFSWQASSVGSNSAHWIAFQGADFGVL